MSESTRRKNRSQAPSLTEQKMFESDNNLKIHGSNVDSSEAELSIERGPTVINKDLARLKTSGNDSHRSNSVVSVKFQAPPSVKPSECESLNSAPKIPSRKADSVMSTASTRASTHNMPLQNLRNKIVRFLYVPSFTEFGFNLANDKGALKSKSSLTARETSNQEGFHPYSAGLVYWGMLMFLIHLLVLYEAPVIAAFETRVHSSDLSIVLTAFFVIDITVQFFSLRIVDGVVEPSILDARWAYLRSGLLLDVLATIPFDIILKKSLRHSEACILIRLLYTRNLARISKTNAYLMKFSRWIQRTFRVGVSFMRIFLLGGILITFLHIHGCLVFFLGKVTGFTGDSWRKVNYLFQEEVNNQYIWSLFVATANTFPVTGFQPTDPIEQVIGILLAIIGAVLYACLVGTISSFSFGLDSSGRKYKEKIDEVNEYMTYRNLSDNIKKKVRDYFEMKYKGKFFDEEAILKEMNDSLRLEIAVHNCQDLIAKVPFLRREMNDGRDEVFMGRIARALRPKYFVKGDIIFEQGWVGNENVLYPQRKLIYHCQSEGGGQPYRWCLLW
ncbi:hypothetical protein BC829DRAFT_185239 [Chytridium lagenaria]|nr:hypothetical protein BC829DRAFT_185239 [Chytridium lagenaria]